MNHAVKIDKRQQEVILAVAGGAKTAREIADVLGLTINAATAHISRTLECGLLTITGKRRAFGGLHGRQANEYGIPTDA